ncbi:DUF4410 domain-containing protein [Acidisoma cellulosilytica]|uniref:DUF4410 domain-containing protein n=1 Tax=Acidisoma cellulosilyticum TaxID=2802395 RepID=A0A963Z0L3_9PROT|nr:DUF4410 domain-containing protein [Acidisoma cellulosilyticum]MCB8880361.1 DUF4410 domain-containing protein [Acidisoma cellulosilyticum]
MKCSDNLARIRLWPAAAIGLLALAGCATHVQNTANYAAPTGYPSVIERRPEIVLVYPFTVDPAEVQLASGVLAKLNSSGEDPNAKRAEIAESVKATITQTLVEDVTKMGLPARAAYPGEAGPPGAVLLQGQITKIAAGNAARRAVIGFGAGESQVEADVGVLRALPGGLVRPLESYHADATSGRTPGLALGAAGAASHLGLAVAGMTAGTVARSRTGLEPEAANLGNKVAGQIRQFFASEGWIAPQ